MNRSGLALVTALSLLAIASFVQVPTARSLPLGDVVFIIDESGSMSADIADVQANVNSIASQLGASIDFQLGLVGFGANSPHAGISFGGEAHIHQTLTSDVPTFQNAVNQLIANGGFEPGFSATVLGMSSPMGFRPGAGVCAILISDEDADSSSQAPETKADALAALNGRSAVFLGIVDSSFGTAANDYGPNPGSLSAETGGQVFDLIAFRADPEPVLTAIIAECVRSITLIVLTPEQAVNPAGTDHTVTAALELDGQPVVGEPVTFEVLSGPNAGASGTCSANSDCTTDANGEVSWTYTGSGGIGIDEVQACFVDPQGAERCSSIVTKEWVNSPPVAGCVESVNPAGKQIPPAGSTTLPGPKGGQNDDGFYQLIGEDAEDGTAAVFVTNASGSAVFGPFASGSVVKITEAPGATPSSKPIGGPDSAVSAHIKLDSDAFVFAVDSAGAVSPTVSCLVPPLPK